MITSIKPEWVKNIFGFLIILHGCVQPAKNTVLDTHMHIYKPTEIFRTKKNVFSRGKNPYTITDNNLAFMKGSLNTC